MDESKEGEIAPECRVHSRPGQQKAAWCQEAMSCILNTPAKKMSISATSKKWANTDIQDRRNAVGREKRRW